MSETQKIRDFVLERMPLNITHFKEPAVLRQPLTTTKISAVAYNSEISVIIYPNETNSYYGMFNERVITSTFNSYQTSSESLYESLEKISKIDDMKLAMSCELYKRGTSISLLYMNEETTYMVMHNTILHTNIMPIKEYRDINIEYRPETDSVKVEVGSISINSKPGYKPVQILEEIYYGNLSWVSDEYAVLDEYPKESHYYNGFTEGVVVQKEVKNVINRNS